MVSNFENELENTPTIQSINFNTLVPTFICFILGLIFYYFKYRHFRDNVEVNNAPNNNNRDRQRENYSNINNNQNINNQNIFEDNNQDNENNENLLKIVVLINSVRNMFNINPDIQVRDFIRFDLIPKISNFNNNQTIILICQGRRLEENKKFRDYSIIKKNTVLHCFITNSNNTGQNSNINSDSNFNYSYQNGNYNTIHQQEDENAVSVYTLLLHSCILFLVTFLVISYKSYKDNLNTMTLFLFQIMILIWILGLSKVVAKLVIHKKIVYN